MYVQFKDAATMLGVSRQTVHAMTRARRLNTRRIAGWRMIVVDGKFALRKAEFAKRRRNK